MLMKFLGVDFSWHVCKKAGLELPFAERKFVGMNWNKFGNKETKAMLVMF
jgi:hypothetical protein